MKRTQPPLKLRNSPLVLVLAQTRFSSVLQMEKYVPEIQERLRKGGFPRFSRQQVQQVIIGPQMNTQVQAATRWLFANADNDCGVLLTPDYLLLQATSYDTFEPFVSTFETVVSTVREIADLDLAEQVGLRYVDIIWPAKGSSVDEYLQSTLRGLDPELLDLKNARSRFESVGLTESGQFTLRISKVDEPFGLPPDLEPTDLTIPSRESAPGPHGIMDLDHISIASRVFDPGALSDVLWDLHDFLDRAFRLSVTDIAMQHWGAEAR
jgi:uncharacterized protein (TIGR04255 family)